jgi:hypothetical protein
VVGANVWRISSKGLARIAINKTAIGMTTAAIPNRTGAWGTKAGGYRRAMRMAAENLVAASSNNHVAAVDIAKLYAHADDRDPTLEWLEKSADVPETGLVYVMANPLYKGLRGDPRFEAIRTRMNLKHGG